jgi:hypothetical protein
LKNLKILQQKLLHHIFNSYLPNIWEKINFPPGVFCSTTKRSAAGDFFAKKLGRYSTIFFVTNNAKLFKIIINSSYFFYNLKRWWCQFILVLSFFCFCYNFVKMSDPVESILTSGIKFNTMYFICWLPNL